MTPAARIEAAITILDDGDLLRRPLQDLLKDWGRANRYAGSKDRSAVASLVYDALRRRRSSAYLMGAETGRALMLGALKSLRGFDLAALDALFTGERHMPAPLTAKERESFSGTLDGAPPAVQADCPEWLEEPLQRAFGDDFVPEMQALATRAPLDLRVNRLKAERVDVLDELAHLAPQPSTLSPDGLRIAQDQDRPAPPVSAEPSFLKGRFEVQDEGSQLVAMLSGAKPGEQVLDLCAGGGGKTLALAALMDNKGQIFATDSDKRRLVPLYERLERAGVRNTQILTPTGRDVTDILKPLKGHMDLALIDAPCTGTGTWRRHPDAKWRLRPGALDERLKDQIKVLDQAAPSVKPGGRLVYITCSVLPQENDEQIEAFLSRHAGFVPASENELLARHAAFFGHVIPMKHGLQFTPATSGTDGFYISLLKKPTA
jgi:16S rRNA (cytosine967-C5)-methyltransferase